METPRLGSVARRGTAAELRGIAAAANRVKLAPFCGFTRPFSAAPDDRPMQEYRLNHLQQLEAESIHIIREVAAEFEKPVMLYSIGKDSSVMLRLAIKAFAPAKMPFPMMHIDTTWKFRDMIAFRNKFAADNGLELIVHTN